MGRRSRKRRPAAGPGEDRRGGPAAAAEPTAGRSRPEPARGAGSLRRRPRLDEAPKAPWAPFPLVELCILIGIVLMVLGLATGGHRGRVELAGGFTLMALSVCELAIREHFAGYRSHSALLAGVAAVGLDALLFFLTALPQLLLLAIGVCAFGVALWALRAAFMRRTGGLGFRA